MPKPNWLLLINVLILFSCVDQAENDGKPYPLTKDEKQINHFFEQFIVQKKITMDSMQQLLPLLDKLHTNKKDIQAQTNIIAGNYYFKKANYQIAIEKYENALKLTDTTSLLADYALYGLGSCYKNLGNFPKSLTFFQQSITNNETRKDTLRLASTYAKLAQLYQEKEDFAGARETIHHVFNLMKNNDSSHPYLISLHTLANVEAQSGNFTQAIEIDKKGILITEKIGNAALKTSFQDNLARCHLYYLKDYEKAKYYFNENLKIDKQLNNPSWIADTYINLAETYTAEGKFEEAEKYLKDAINIFTESKQLNNALKGYQALAALYQQQGKLQKALEAKETYLQQYKKSLNEKSEQSFAEYNILFETHKKEKELSDANLQIAQNKLASKQKNIWLMALASAILIGLIVIRNQAVKAHFTKKKLQLENQLIQEQAHSQIQQQRLQISRDLHDSLGAQLTFVNSTLDGLKNSAPKLDEKINLKINSLSNFSENAIAELRNTLWVLHSNNLNLSDLKAKTLNFINKAAEAKDTIRFHFTFDLTRDAPLSSRQAINLFRIIQEVVNNAIKYSVAKNIEINISQQEKLLKMSIADDGIGFDYDQVKTSSYGLTNIQNRVDEINGKLKVETAVNRGTRFNIETQL